MEPEQNQDVKPASDPKPVVQKPKPKSKMKPKKAQSDPKAPRRTFFYGAHHNDLDHYGVIVEWDEKNLTHNQVHNKFEKVLSLARNIVSSLNQVRRPMRSIKRKPMPYFRRTGRTKGIVTFQTWPEANAFSAVKHPDFRAFIPMAFIVTIGVVHFNAPKINIKDAFACCLGEYEIMQWRIKRIEPNKLRVTFAVCGTELPKSILFHDKKHPVERFVRQPVRCTRCLRYGHRAGSCFRKPRCGTCAQEKSTSWHAERLCRVIRNDRGSVWCTYCNDGHAAGGADCVEENYQRTYKGQLSKHNMDFARTLELEIIPMVRSTSINSNRVWCD